MLSTQLMQDKQQKEQMGEKEGETARDGLDAQAECNSASGHPEIESV